jgi:general secretion pathway protein D
LLSTRKDWLAALVLTIALASPALAQQPPQRLTLNFANTEIEAVARAVADFTGRTIIVDPRVKGALTLAVDQPMTPEQALAMLSSALRMQNLALVDSGGVIRIVPEADAKLQGGPVQSGTPPAGRGDEIVTQVFHLNYESAASIAQVLRPLIATNNPINAYPGNNTIVVTDYAENVRRIARIIAAVDTPAGNQIDVIPLQHAIASDMAVILSRLLESGPQPAAPDAGRVSILAEPTSNSLLIRAPTPARANLVRVLAAKLDQPSAAPGNIHVVYLKNANAVTLARTLLGVSGPDQSQGLAPTPTPLAAQSQLSGSRPVGTSPAQPLTGQTGTQQPVSGQIAGAQIQADPATNTLIVIAPEVVYRNLRAVIDKLDMRRAQVFIESLIIEVTSDQAAELGIQWQGGLGHLSSGTGALAGTNFGTAGQNILGIAQNPATIGQGLAIGVASGQITLPGVGVVSNLQVLARALETMSKANILSTPNILTLDNEEARIVVGQNVPFITGQFVTPASGGGATVNPFQTVERRDVGLTLRVRPQISESGTIKLVIYQEVSSVDNTSNAAGIITNMRAIETKVLVDNGGIVVLGGLMQDTYNNTTDKVPVLGDLPLIGQLFRFETRRQQKTNLMVFLRPYIVRDQSEATGLALDRYDNMRRLEETTAPTPNPALPAMQPPVAPPSPPPQQ